MSKLTLITSRDPKGLHAVGLFEAAYNKSKLDDTRAQRLNECGGELQDGIAKLIAELSVPNQFADEEVRSSCTYSKKYKGAKPISDQIKVIAKIFGLDPSHALAFAKTLPELPNGAEGWFAIPSVDAVAAKHFPEVTEPAYRYCQAVHQLVHSEIKIPELFYNFYEIMPPCLRVHARTTYALHLITERQKGDILIVAAQLGIRHRGKSVRRAREGFAANEFGLGAFAVGCMILTHLERLDCSDDLGIDCSGDEYSSKANSDFLHAPVFSFRDCKVKFSVGEIKFACEGCGSASAFLPQ